MSAEASSHHVLSREYNVKEDSDVFSDYHLRWSADLDKTPKTSTLASKDAVRIDYSQEYNGQPPPTQGEWSLDNSRTIKTRVRRPWFTHLEGTTQDHYARISDEIIAFESYMRPTLAEDTAFQLSITAMRKIIIEALPFHIVSLHGSRSTGLASPLSDVDISVYPKNPGNNYLRKHQASSSEEKKATAVRILKVLKKTLDYSGRFRKNIIVHASVPIISTIDTHTGLVYQIQTLTPVAPSRKWTMKYLSEYPDLLRPLYILLRQALLMRGMTSVQDGGLGSYSLLMMIVTAIRISPEDDNLASQLLQILEFWSKQDLYVAAYGAECGLQFHKSYKTFSVKTATENPYTQGMDVIRRVQADRPWLLCLQDPGNPMNDLGKRCTRIKHIQSYFAAVLDSIRDYVHHSHIQSEFTKAPSNFSGQSSNKPEKGILDHLIDARYDTFRAKRKTLVKAGEMLDVFERDERTRNSQRIWNEMLDRSSIYDQP
ncbi:hypothetical protein MMC14_003868 [Varicellaria rhodocarpa]|nr:hypothetical protein [Varicellaria rhodocarpa]